MRKWGSFMGAGLAFALMKASGNNYQAIFLLAAGAARWRGGCWCAAAMVLAMQAAGYSTAACGCCCSRVSAGSCADARCSGCPCPASCCHRQACRR